MDLKQTLALVVDFLIHVDDRSVKLSPDPIDAIEMALQALIGAARLNLNDTQMEEALDALQRQCEDVAADDSGNHKTAASTNQQERTASAAVQKPPAAGSVKRVLQRSTQANTAQSSGKRRKLQDQVATARVKQAANQTLVDQLVQLGDYELHHNQAQRGTTRMRAAMAIRDADVVITSGAQARQLEGVGPSGAAKVDELLHGGLSQAMREYRRK